MFSLRMVARPDARMVEVPLELEVQLPQEFEGAAVLASSGVPRKVRLKAPRDAVRLSTAYRADELLAEVVRVVLAAPPADVQRVQEATKAFVREVRERKKAGATLVVRSRPGAALEVSSLAEPRPAAPRRASPAPREAQPLPSSLREAAEARVAALEAALSKVTAAGERIAALERRLQKLEERVAAATAGADVAGPGLERRPVAVKPAEARGHPGLDAFAEGLRSELRARLQPVLAQARAEAEEATRAAALAADAGLLLRVPGVDPSRLQEDSAEAAAHLAAAERVYDALDLCGPADLALADRLVPRLEEVERRDRRPQLESLARAVVESAAADEDADRRHWLDRACALCVWTLVDPAPGTALDPDLHAPIDGGGGPISSVACPGLRRPDGSLLVPARVRAGGTASSPASPPGEPPSSPATRPSAAWAPLDPGPQPGEGAGFRDRALEGAASVDELEVTEADLEDALELGPPRGS